MPPGFLPIRRYPMTLPSAISDPAVGAASPTDNSGGQRSQRSEGGGWLFPCICCAPGRRAVRGVRTATGPPVAARWIHAVAPEVRCTSLVPARAARRDVARSGECGPRPVPGRSTLDSRSSSRGSPHAASSRIRCAPGRRAVRGVRTATGPRSQHSGFTPELQRFAARR